MTLHEAAATFIGQEEIPENQGFRDPTFHALMKRVGWYKPLAWCAFFVKACFAVCSDAGVALVNLVSPSAVKTFRAYEKAGRTYKTEPIPGDLAVWQKYKNGKPTPFGHIGVVAPLPEKVKESYLPFACIEGNTDEAGGREGDQVALKIRSRSFAKKINGLVLLGFCKTAL